MNTERVECTWQTPEGKEVQVSSAGVLVHCFGDLVYQGKSHFLMGGLVDDVRTFYLSSNIETVHLEMILTAS